MGLRCGTRLEQLEELARRINHEIDSERRALALGERARPAVKPLPVAPRPDPVMDALDKPLPPTKVIRRWAIDNGYLPETQLTGPLAQDVLDLYREQALS